MRQPAWQSAIIVPCIASLPLPRTPKLRAHPIIQQPTIMKASTGTLLLVIAIAAQPAAAFQTSTRRALVHKLAKSSGAAVASSLLLPNVASAAEKKPKKALLRGGKNASDALHNGTDLVGAEAEVASGLLDKMGMSDITPDKGPSSRAPPAPKKKG